ncbi:N-(5'-phosphoribosyl)anthranilate isomerase [Neisseria gonorrhoeae]|uniref:N-(5'-phosphoribosyl)anthranilate isomerase n=1 Tax=Neisseria gonorrhoeae TaxID=485 RepID=A0A378W118_NEIGO|nr:N-(5'-phosphoribosyl)anthranilate isomerase [Neisseria gonorrhoeae]
MPIHIIQFHGDEDDAFCRQFDRPYIKAIRVQTASDIRNAATRFPNAQALLFDAYHPSEYGGTGHRFDWTLLAEYSGKPWVLAGGLTLKTSAKPSASPERKRSTYPAAWKRLKAKRPRQSRRLYRNRQPPIPLKQQKLPPE